MTARPLPENWLRSDALTAALLAGLGCLMAYLTDIQMVLFPGKPLWATFISCVVLAAPLVWRRRFPLTVNVCVHTLYISLAYLTGIEGYVSQVIVFMAFYSVGAWSPQRRVVQLIRIATVVAMGSWLVINVLTPWNAQGRVPQFETVTQLLSAFAFLSALNIAFYAGAWYFGNRTWQQAVERTELERAYRDIRVLKEELVSHAVEEERLRIARELHDVVAHHVTTMSVQSAAARRLISTDPDRAAESLKHVESSARLAVKDLRSMVFTLRSGDDAEEMLPTLDQLDALVASARRAEATVSLERIGQIPPLSPAVELTLYRVAQEALTNVAKHAGPTTSAAVRLRARAESVELEVSDNGIGTRRGVPGTGTGLIGMRERVIAVGGTLEAGPKPRGGFLVRAEIPTGVPA